MGYEYLPLWKDSSTGRLWAENLHSHQVHVNQEIYSTPLPLQGLTISRPPEKVLATQMNWTGTRSWIRTLTNRWVYGYDGRLSKDEEEISGG